MSQKQYSTRLPEDYAEELEQYCEERNISKAEALRRSVQEMTDTSSSSEPDYLWRTAMVAGIVLLAISVTGTVPDYVTLLGAVTVAVLHGLWWFSF